MCTIAAVHCVGAYVFAPHMSAVLLLLLPQQFVLAALISVRTTCYYPRISRLR